MPEYYALTLTYIRTQAEIINHQLAVLDAYLLLVERMLSGVGR